MPSPFKPLINNLPRNIYFHRLHLVLGAGIALLVWVLTACRSPLLAFRATETPLPSATPLPTATPNSTTTRTPTPTSSPTCTPSSIPTSTATFTPTTTVTSTATRTSTPTYTPVPPTLTSPGFVIVDLDHTNGPLVDQLRLEAQKAQELGLKPFAEFSATWCPPCQAIASTLEQKNPLMLDTFDGTYIIRMDVDIWSQAELQEAGFQFEYIPIFYRLDADGKPNGDWIDGSAWGENTPENMAPPLKKFFQGKS